MKDLSSKTIVVCGSHGLIGQAICRGLQARVLTVDLHPEAWASGDLSSQTFLGELSTKLRGEKIHGWVNVHYPRTKDWGNTEYLDDTQGDGLENLSLHMGSYYSLCQIALSTLVKPGGSLVNFSSIYGLVGPDFSIYEGTQMKNPAMYSAIKGGIQSLSRYLATRFGTEGVRVNTVSPGGVFNDQPANFVKAYEKKVPLGRMATPEDIAGPVTFLLSEESKYITGQNLAVDGGLTAM